ncbi:hypothetical protein BJ508DRAFT_335931 [Ascobolus immersus RN42]|uniref:Uncharacterized protein n=1 Tax=Ascobolus immersus RN42 TaxID=1160509 RepID=A0A3N4HAF4_ASCIM|nr:hypothetical protein BJ508DRAFT_335931 [Ascobolus immersus RN42]
MTTLTPEKQAKASPSAQLILTLKPRPGHYIVTELVREVRGNPSFLMPQWEIMDRLHGFGLTSLSKHFLLVDSLRRQQELFQLHGLGEYDRTMVTYFKKSDHNSIIIGIEPLVEPYIEFRVLEYHIPSRRRRSKFTTVQYNIRSTLEECPSTVATLTSNAMIHELRKLNSSGTQEILGLAGKSKDVVYLRTKHGSDVFCLGLQLQGTDFEAQASVNPFPLREIYTLLSASEVSGDRESRKSQHWYDKNFTNVGQPVQGIIRIRAVDGASGNPEADEDVRKALLKMPDRELRCLEHFMDWLSKKESAEFAVAGAHCKFKKRIGPYLNLVEVVRITPGEGVTRPQGSQAHAFSTLHIFPPSSYLLPKNDEDGIQRFQYGTFYTKAHDELKLEVPTGDEWRGAIKLRVAEYSKPINTNQEDSGLTYPLCYDDFLKLLAPESLVKSSPSMYSFLGREFPAMDPCYLEYLRQSISEYVQTMAAENESSSATIVRMDGAAEQAYYRDNGTMEGSAHKLPTVWIDLGDAPPPPPPASATPSLNPPNLGGLLSPVPPASATPSPNPPNLGGLLPPNSTTPSLTATSTDALPYPQPRRGLLANSQTRCTADVKPDNDADHLPSPMGPKDIADALHGLHIFEHEAYNAAKGFGDHDTMMTTYVKVDQESKAVTIRVEPLAGPYIEFEILEQEYQGSVGTNFVLKSTHKIPSSTEAARSIMPCNEMVDNLKELLRAQDSKAIAKVVALTGEENVLCYVQKGRSSLAGSMPRLSLGVELQAQLQFREFYVLHRPKEVLGDVAGQRGPQLWKEEAYTKIRSKVWATQRPLKLRAGDEDVQTLPDQRAQIVKALLEMPDRELRCLEHFTQWLSEQPEGKPEFAVASTRFYDHHESGPYLCIVEIGATNPETNAEDWTGVIRLCIPHSCNRNLRNNDFKRLTSFAEFIASFDMVEGKKVEGSHSSAYRWQALKAKVELKTKPTATQHFSESLSTRSERSGLGTRLKPTYVEALRDTMSKYIQTLQDHNSKLSFFIQRIEEAAAQPYVRYVRNNEEKAYFPTVSVEFCQIELNPVFQPVRGNKPGTPDTIGGSDKQCQLGVTQ